MPTDQNDKQTPVELELLRFFLASVIGFMGFMGATMIALSIFGQEWALPVGIISGIAVTFGCCQGPVVAETEVKPPVSQEVSPPVCDDAQEPVGVRRTSYSPETLKFTQVLGIAVLVFGLGLGISASKFFPIGSELGHNWFMLGVLASISGVMLVIIGSVKKSS